jgi:CHAT domain/SIR2-like domain
VPVTAYADLEIGLHRWDADSYGVDLRCSRPDSDADLQVVRGGVRFDLDGLRTLSLDPVAYGRLLGENLFSNRDIQTTFREARSNAQSRNAQLRLRLSIHPSAPELHGLRWETLRDPRDGAALLSNEEILFSRYLSSLDWRPARLRPKADLKALVVIANPAGLGSSEPGGWPQFAPLDVPGELVRARSGLGSIAMTSLASGGSATLNTLCAQLRDGYDILYLVCHGALIRDEPRPARPATSGDGDVVAGSEPSARLREPWLWLEDEAGKAAVVAGSELVAQLRELQQPPRLIVLASCQSAGGGADARRGDDGALAALGPRLAEAGIPAVLAMQGSVSMQTVAQFMPVFFRELQRDGQIDRAMAAARGAARERPDAWMPVLFMRLKSGRIWYVPGFAGKQEFEKWPDLLMSIREGRCTPILGPGLIEPLFGSSREIARRWAEQHRFPLAPHAREDLPQVAQYLTVNQSLSFPRRALGESLRQEILRRHGSDVPEELRRAKLDQLVEAVGARRRQRDPAEPHKVLAHLPFPIYITANPDNLLARALEEAGKTPEVVLCPWNDYVERELTSVYDNERDYEPTPERPLVYHLFGQLREPQSLVLTEDDYFDYLIGVSSKKKLIPTEVPHALTDSALLFLGFQMDDWNFRALFRSLLGQEGRGRRSGYAHVGVQIAPEEGRILEPERAREYLEKSYFQDAAISIYWGTAEDFVKELVPRCADGSFEDLAALVGSPR